eukprot:2012319-Ditylum_brightwellii.AAC.1
MPGPAAILVGPGAVATAKAMAYHAASLPNVGSATLTTGLFYWGFQRLPDWVKQDISFRGLLKNRKDVSKEELEGLFSVLEKLQSMVSNVQELDTDIPQLHAAMLAFIQLSGQIKISQVENGSFTKTQSHVQSTYTPPLTTTRDSLYETAGNALNISTLRSDEIKLSLKMATYAYYDSSEILAEKLNEMDYTVLQHKLEFCPGKVAHYSAVSPTERLLVVGFRGTSTLSDILTDCCGRAVPLVDHNSIGDKIRVEIKAADGCERITLEDHDNDGDNFVRCHEGILISAKNVLNEIEPFLLPLVECRYRVIFCGHSLGAATAIVTAILLRSKYPDLFLDTKQIH